MVPPTDVGVQHATGDADQGERAWAVEFSPPKAALLAASSGDAAVSDQAAAVLRVQQFAERAVLDFGQVQVGAAKTLCLALENATANPQELAAHKVPLAESFRLSDDPAAPPAAGLAWTAHLQPGACLLLPVTWAPAKAGAVAASLGLRLDGKHVLQVRLVGSAAQAAPLSRTSSLKRAAVVGAARGGVLRETSANRPQQAPAGAAAAGAAPAAGAPAFKVPAARAPPSSSAGGRAPPAPRGQPLQSSLRLKRAPSAASAVPAEAHGVGGDRQREEDQLVTPRGQVLRTSRPLDAGRPGSAAASPITPAAASSRAGGVAGAAAGAARAARPPSAREAPKARAPSVAGSSSRGGKGSPAASAAATPSTASTSKKARKTFSFFHTELWMQKQDKAFSAWLNHLLVPSDDEGACAPAALTDRRLAASVRGALVSCYRRDAGLRDAVMRVEARVDSGQLRLRDEAVQLGDVATRDRAVAALMAYHPFWLRAGLEVVTQRAVAGAGGALAARGAAGVAAPLSSRTPDEELRAFLVEHFLGDKDLARESEAARGAAHYDTDSYWRDLGELTVKRFLLLALLLDRVASDARAARAPVPLLFRVDSTIKSSGEAVHAFLHGRLVGEGNLLRHLELLGYRLCYEQSPLAEYPYAVSNLAVDLRDGLRLIKVAELLAGAADLSDRARFPADRRPLALHNVGLALSALRAAGVPLDSVPTARGLAALRPDDLVDGDRDRSLALLWAAARALQLPRLLRPGALRAEVARVLARARREARRGGGGAAAAAAAREVPLAVYMNDELACLLMEWVQAVAMQSGAAVRNFTTCFGDGRVLCLLVAYYLPNALDAASIYVPEPFPEDEPDPEPAADELHRPGGWCAMFDAGGCVRDAAAERHRAGVAANFAAVHRAARSLGGVPEMLSPSDWAEHGPDERAVMLYSAFLCNRLLECSREDRAAHIIQRAWRDACARKSGSARAHLEMWIAAAAVVTRAAKAWLFRRAVARMLAGVAAQREAAVVLQAAWRGRAVRVEVARAVAAATVIQRRWRIARTWGRRARAATAVQSAWRGHAARREFGWMRRYLDRCLRARGALVDARDAARRERAAIKLQAHWRGAAARRDFRRARAAVVRAQALARGAAARRGLVRQHAAAARIQAAWRGHSVRQAVRASAAFATFLQACYRSRRQRVAFLRLRAAAITLQASRRGAVARRRFLEAKAAATTVQAGWRGHAVRREVAQQHAAATSIQAAWRSAVAQSQLQRARGAATKLQAAWRMHAATSALAAQRGAALTLQRAWRCRSAARLLAAHKAAATVQAGWRGHVVRRQVAQQQAAATVVQAGWRRHVARRGYCKQQVAAIAIQAACRGKLARAALQQQQAAAAVLQRTWRCREALRALAEHRAAARIQAHARGWAVRREVTRQHVAATRVQAGWRSHAAQQAYQRQRRAAIALQAGWRGHAVRREVARQHAAATSIQAAWRSAVAQSQLQCARAAATKLQAAWRMHAATSAIASQRGAALTLQRAWRCRSAARLLAAHKAAATVQAGWRGHVVRRQVAQQQAAATVVQAGWRGHVVRRQVAQQQAAATVVQAGWRGHVVRRSVAQQHAAATVLQAGWRGHVVRRNVAQQQAAATVVQAGWRQHTARSSFLCLKRAAVALQSACRGKLARTALQQQQAAAAVLQRTWRCREALRALAEHRAAARIQAHARGWAVRREVARQHAAATRVQAGWRSHAAQQAYQRQRRAAIALQAGTRCWLARRELTSCIAAAVALQSAWRGAAVRAELRRQSSAATRIQAAWRSHAARAAFLRAHSAAVTIQAAARMAPARARFLEQRGAATALQAAVRGAQARALARRARAAVEIQRRWRGHAARGELEAKRAAALCLQCAMRGLMARRQAQAVRDYIRSANEFQKMLMELHHRTMAATLIQSAWRARVVRHVFEPVWAAHQRAKAEAAAAATIQRGWRARCFRAQLAERLEARAVISRHVPMLRARLQLRRARAAALAVQAAWRLQAARRAVAAVALQSAVRGWLARRRAERIRDAAVLIQAAWRGHRVRRRAGRNGREARARLEAAAAAAECAPHKRIGVRAREALKVLLASKQCTQVITAVSAIEFSTRYSRDCCALIAESGGVPALLSFMRSCNRSKPHAEMLRLALGVLHNVARWRELAPAVLGAPECVAVLSERLQMFRDMEDVFLSVVGLLSKLAASDDGALAVAEAAAPSFLRQWEGVASIIGRRIDMERKYIARLEGQKGSDASAREATRKMVSGAKQLEALSTVIRRVAEAGEAAGLAMAHLPPGGGGASGGGEPGELPPMDAVAHPESLAGAAAAAWRPKNTIVRGAFREMARGGADGGAGARDTGSGGGGGGGDSSARRGGRYC
ncbi:hypothetical protein Rsub_07853 [Raphidocelis subcapitata]|uniref:Calponin-homology (CH) domain-containing protein n=1 Tax=Raphidocelis subcapitata TaxID=307507 RepID=A0A2V0PC77_9CHLO|nr:hypothetical protein Rsub_07853 [Raphidocelis subcapitata]|eukprot:GBF95503.1 hypothetical protein Rsub_07853 [Raphidocelis subcapitata]